MCNTSTFVLLPLHTEHPFAAVLAEKCCLIYSDQKMPLTWMQNLPMFVCFKKHICNTYFKSGQTHMIGFTTVHYYKFKTLHIVFILKLGTLGLFNYSNMTNNISLTVLGTNVTGYQHNTVYLQDEDLFTLSAEEFSTRNVDGAILMASGIFLLLITITSTVVCTFVLWSLARRHQLTKATYRMVGYLMVIELLVR